MNEHLPSELITSAEAMKRAWIDHSGTSRKDLEDLRIIAVYRTITDGFMIGMFVFNQYVLCYLDRYRTTKRTTRVVGVSSDTNLKFACQEIASIIGATLIEEVQG